MKRLIGLAGAAILVFGGLHALGLRDDVAVLSGSKVGSAAGGVLYALAYFAAVVGAPVALLAAIGLGAVRRLLR